MKNKVAQFQEFALPRQRNVKRIVVVGLSVLALSVSMYVYLIGKIVFDVVGRRTAESSIRSTQSALSSLGTSYFKKTASLTLAQAGNLGLYESHDTLYASRSNDAAKTVGFVSRR